MNDTILYSLSNKVHFLHQDAIREYSGTVITVSHDRYFIKQIVNRVIEVKDCNLQDYAGDYSVSSNVWISIHMFFKQKKNILLLWFIYINL